MSPTESIFAVERFIDGCQSRNERLAGLMRRFGICEGHFMPSPSHKLTHAL